MKRGWLVYDESDLALNQDFATYMESLAPSHGLRLETVCTRQLELGLADGGALRLRKDGQDTLPDFVISRQRDAFVSAQLEGMDVPVFNNAKVCALCNDKRVTHQFLAGIPMLATRFVNHRYASAPQTGVYPLMVKPANGHGGDRVRSVANEFEWRDAVDDILPQDIVEQKIASDAGKDLRVYVVFGKIVAAVMRTAKKGIISNFKRGGNVALHTLTEAEQTIVKQVIDRFAQAGAPLCFAGVDLLYDHARPVLSEVEDVVGSRMLYQVSTVDIAALFLAGISERLI